MRKRRGIKRERGGEDPEAIAGLYLQDGGVEGRCIEMRGNALYDYIGVMR